MKSRIPKTFIDELLNRIDIIEIINQHVTLQEKGQNHHGLCPFHAEKTPSFTASRRKQFYHCFGCGAHGNAIDFTMQQYQCHFVESIEKLANMIGLTLPQDDQSETPTYKARAKLYPILNNVADFYHQQLLQSSTIVAYLHKRGIHESIIKQYAIGYAPPKWRNLTQNLYDNHTQALVDCGLLIAKSKHQVYDRLRDRIIFPIYDHKPTSTAQVIGFGGRTLGSDQPKYINSPETLVFKKRFVIYGLRQILTQQSRPKSLLIVEGYMDVISLSQHGIHNAVATLGTSISSQQVQLLLKYTSKLAFCFDGDRAGELAAWRALETVLPLLSDGVYVKFIFLPKNEDPDSYIKKHGKTAFKAQCQNGLTVSDYFFKHNMSGININSLSGKAEYAAKCQQYIEKLPPTIFKRLLEKQLSAQLHIDPTHLASLPSCPTISTSTLPTHTTLSVSQPMSALDQIFFILLNDTHNIDIIVGAKLPLDGTHPKDALLQKLIASLQTDPNLNTAALIEQWRDDSECFYYLNNILQIKSILPPARLNGELHDAIKLYQSQHLQNEINDLLTLSKTQALTKTQQAHLKRLIIKKSNLLSTQK